jgi:OOP family OmpA-OmpF porin
MSSTACQKKAGEGAASPQVSAMNDTAPVGVTPETAPKTDQNSAAVASAAKFDISSVPVSKVVLGSFPYLSLPDGYEAGNAKTMDLAKVPYWVEDHFEWIEGKVYQSSISGKTGKDFSGYEVKRNIEALVQQAGGKLVFEGTIPNDIIKKLPEDVRLSSNTGLGGWYSDPVDIYLIHQADKNISVQLSTNTAGGSWAVTESKPFVPTAKLL